LKEAADRGERAAKRRFEQQQKVQELPVVDENPKVRRADEVHLRVSGQKVTPQLDQGKVVKEDETSVTYEVPMHPEGNGEANAILDKFELTARINKESHQFERATIRQRASLRVKLIAKVSDTVLEFESVRRTRAILGADEVYRRRSRFASFRESSCYAQRIGAL